jgi:hypothetical protein
MPVLVVAADVIARIVPESAGSNSEIEQSVSRLF